MQRAASFLPLAFRNFVPKTGKKVCIIGGGSAGFFCAERLRHLFDVTVVDPKNYYEYSPGMCRALVQPFNCHKRLTFDYKHILEEEHGVEFVQGYVDRLHPRDPKSRKGLCEVVDWSGNALTNLSFDYCIVAAGIQNGIWKQPFETLEERMEQIRDVSRGLREQSILHVVGAGIVGVELAAEFAYYLKKPVKLYDGNPRLLFQLPIEAHEYAKDWLETRNCSLMLSQGFDFENHGDDPNVWTCVGVKPTNSFLDSAFLDEKGFVKVNRSLQIMGVIPGENDDTNMVEHSVIDGLYACGDCVSLEGAPKTAYVAEEMSAIVVSNIERSEGYESELITTSTDNQDSSKTVELRQMSDDLVFPFCVSLGPQDGIFAQNSADIGGQIVTDGRGAAVQKQIIEDTKLAAMRGDEIVSKFAWSLVH